MPAYDKDLLDHIADCMERVIEYTGNDRATVTSCSIPGNYSRFIC